MVRLGASRTALSTPRQDHTILLHDGVTGCSGSDRRYWRTTLFDSKTAVTLEGLPPLGAEPRSQVLRGLGLGPELGLVPATLEALQAPVLQPVQAATGSEQVDLDHFAPRWM